MLDYEDYEDDDGGSDKGEMEVDIYSCGHCPKNFTERRNLTRHVKDIHEKRKLYQCGICSKTFTRRQNKELHVKTCACEFGSERTKKSRISLPVIKFYPKLLDSVFNGIMTTWRITYHADVFACDYFMLLKESTKAMKDIILKQLHEKTKILKFTMSVHVVFEKGCDPEIRTVPSVVLTTDPKVVYIATNIDECLKDAAEELYEKIETYEGCGSGCTVDYLKRLHIGIYSF